MPYPPISSSDLLSHPPLSLDRQVRTSHMHMHNCAKRQRRPVASGSLLLSSSSSVSSLAARATSSLSLSPDIISWTPPRVSPCMSVARIWPQATVSLRSSAHDGYTLGTLSLSLLPVSVSCGHNAYVSLGSEKRTRKTTGRRGVAEWGAAGAACGGAAAAGRCGNEEGKKKTELETAAQKRPIQNRHERAMREPGHGQPATARLKSHRCCCG